jgi:hypothetical protein
MAGSARAVVIDPHARRVGRPTRAVSDPVRCRFCFNL